MNLGPPWSAVKFLRTITVNINVRTLEAAPVCDVDSLPAILQPQKYNSLGNTFCLLLLSTLAKLGAAEDLTL